MTNRLFPLTRRGLLTGLGGALLGPLAPTASVGQGRTGLKLSAIPTILKPDHPVWALQGPDPGTAIRFRRGDALDIVLDNRLPVATALQLHGLDGAAAVEPLLGRSPLAAGTSETFSLPLRHAGTLMADVRLLGDAATRPSRPLAIVVEEEGAPPTDRDEVLLIEDFRLRPAGTAMAPGTDAKDAATLYTINGQASLDITARTNERLRFRIINGCQRQVIAFKFENQDVQVMAIDGQPSEPFPARNGAIVLAPGNRFDVFIDAVKPGGSASAILLHDGVAQRPLGRIVMSGDAPLRGRPLAAAIPLPSNGLPEQIELRNAQRVDLVLGAGGSPPDWLPPAGLSAATAPAFRAKAGRVVVLALTNRTAIPTVFHLDGHHFRLLDRLDDGWKPFWLDTLVVDAGQTQRVAFVAATPGRWLMQAMAANWAAPRLVRWFAVE
jgi:FtsP/CotA-like multicopper oxidase with cupredoxin domain